MDGMGECETELSAYVAECAALAHGAWAAARLFPGRSTAFLSDCVAALGVAACSVQFDATGTAGTMYGMHLLRKSRSAGRIVYQYVPGHEGYFGNELVDAKAAVHGHCVGHLDLGDCATWLAGGGPLLPWFALACRALQQDPVWPSVHGCSIQNHHADRAEAPHLLRPFLQPQYFPGTEAEAPDTRAANSASIPTLALRIATYNALSLAAPSKLQEGRGTTEGIVFRIARPALLAQCLQDADVDIASIQESRCATGIVHTGCYFRVCSGAESGNFGTEVWIRKDRAILHDGHKQARLQLDRVVVHHVSPRRLLLSLDLCGRKLFVLALHGPHRGAEQHIVSKWWHETIHICRTTVGAHDCIIAGDCDASVGSITSDFISDVYPEKEDLAGGLLHQLLQERNAWLPATFAATHSGESWTYMQKRNGRQIRPDMIAIPFQWG